MWEELRVLVIDQNPDTAKTLMKALSPDVKLSEVDHESTTHRALQALLEEEYHMCFISDNMPLEETEIFIQDVSKLKRKRECVFVQLRESLPPDFDRTCLQSRGFQYIISKHGTHKDKEGIKHVLREFSHGCEVKRRVNDVNDIIHIALSEIDKAAENLRRGSKAKPNTLAIDFIADQTEFDKEVLNNYFNTLQDKAAQALPAEATKLEVPAEVLGRALPHLKQDFYSGVSHRVWNKLIKRYGKKR